MSTTSPSRTSAQASAPGADDAFDPAERGLMGQPAARPTAEDSWRHFEPLDLPPILAVTLRQIVSVGYHATTVRAIAKDVGVTVPALYYHYENKQAMLVDLLDRAMDIVTEHTDAALAAAGEDPADQLGTLVQAIALYMARFRELAFLDSERRALEPDNLAHYKQRRQKIELQIRGVIESGHAAGVFKTPHPAECARAILSMCQGIAGWYRPNGPHTEDQVAEQYRRFALQTAEYSAGA